MPACGKKKNKNNGESWICKFEVTFNVYLLKGLFMFNLMFIILNSYSVLNNGNKWNYIFYGRIIQWTQYILASDHDLIFYSYICFK